MREKQRIQILLILAFAISFLFAFKFFWKQEVIPSAKQSEKVKVNKKIDACMKPAWYRFFIPPNSQILEKSLEKIKLHFIIKQNTDNVKLLNITLCNRTKDDVFLPIQNQSLLMIQEAKDENGNWKPIEYWNKDWQMGINTKGKFKLEKNKSIFCTAPKYEGDFKTEVRFKLKIIEANFTEKIIYSPEFTGNINPGQFAIDWDKETRLKSENVSYLDD